jgi:hypothetical protein
VRIAAGELWLLTFVSTLIERYVWIPQNECNIGPVC